MSDRVYLPIRCPHCGEEITEKPPMSGCIIKECVRESKTRGMCQRHYYSHYKYGDPLEVDKRGIVHLTNKQRLARSLEAFRLFKEGLSYAEIGRRIGHAYFPEEPITGEAAKSWVRKGCRWELGKIKSWSEVSDCLRQIIEEHRDR